MSYVENILNLNIFNDALTENCVSNYVYSILNASFLCV